MSSPYDTMHVHHAYLHSLSCGLMLISFPLIKHVFFFIDSLVDDRPRKEDGSFGGYSQDHFLKAGSYVVEAYAG
jgi:hypothetical protein